MVYTVTFNPAIDYVVHTAPLALGSVNRSTREEIYCGGKGINVAVMLRELGVPAKALGFVAGFTGSAIEQELKAKGIETDFVHLKSGCSRINVKIKAEEETEINGRGPDIDDEALNALFDKLNEVQDGDTVVLAGSIPGTLPDDIYQRILSRLSSRRIRAVVDATGELLVKVLPYKPFLIKPNNHELEDIFGVRLHSDEELRCYAQKLKEMGAVNVLVSMAKDGALLLDEQGRFHRLGVCKGTVKNSVGAGDSMVAGFIAGAAKGDYDYALKLGTATGGATAFSDGLGTKEVIFRLLQELDG